MGTREKNEVVHFWVSHGMHSQIRNIAKAEGSSISAVCRDLIEKGLVAGGYRSGEQNLCNMVKTAAEEALKPQIERLASISAKATQIGAAAFFMSVYSGKLLTPDYLKGDFDDAAVQARKLGVEYLKLPRDRSLDDFISTAFHRMEDETD